MDEVAGWQQQFRAETDNSFVYLSDEFYLKAGRPLPADEIYDDYPQLENGIGLVRSFITDWEAAGGCSKLVVNRKTAEDIILVIAGTAFAPSLTELLRPLSTAIQVEAVVNQFFGSAVNVSGLLTGSDIVAHVRALAKQPQRLIIPATTLRKGTEVFLDGMTLAELRQIVDIPVQVADGALELWQRLAGEE